jgi:EAL and modified HD-GYP domain-containing signal transduction protein
MLGMPLETALANLTLPDSVTQALLHRSGPLAHYLTLTLACESGDDEAFAQSAQALQLTEKQINWAHLQALAWAETLGET